jgi:hypothetical protein
MVTRLDISKAAVSNYSGQPAVSVETKNMDGPSDAKETRWDNDNFTQNWAYFLSMGDLKSAFLMKSVWNTGKGYKADGRTTEILDRIRGWGKDTFEDILFNADLIANVGGGSYTQIIRDPEDGTLVNLRPMDPAKMSNIVDSQGMLKRFEQTTSFPKKGFTNRIKNFLGITHVQKFAPEEIFYLTNNRLGDQIHGISDIEGLEPTILAEKESFEDMQKLQHFQVRPFIIFKLKTDDDDIIDGIITKIENTRQKGEDLFIPDDDNILSYEVVQVNPSQIIMDWRNDLKNKFYRQLGMPMIIFGASGSTESGGKIEYAGHEQVFERNQRKLEKQFEAQVGLKIDLISPASLLGDLQGDEAKDANQGLEFQKSDVQAGGEK